MTKRSYVGADNVHIAGVTTDDASAYAADTPAHLAPVMKISTSPKTASKTQYADDGPWDVMTSKGETVLDVEITGITVEQEADLLGNAYDPATGRATENGGTAPYKALSFRSKKSDANYRYFQYLKGRFSPPSEEFASETDSPDPKGIKFTFTAIRTVHKFAQAGGITDTAKYVKGDTEDAVFDESTWFDAVQVPTATTPDALTCTPSPADAAVDQATSVAITLTFNNPLAGGAENGIGLVRSDTKASIAVTRSINAARTVVTLAHSALTAATTYLINVNGVTDRYGQALVDTTYDFATA